MIALSLSLSEQAKGGEAGRAAAGGGGTASNSKDKVKGPTLLREAEALTNYLYLYRRIYWSREGGRGNNNPAKQCHRRSSSENNMLVTGVDSMKDGLHALLLLLFFGGRKERSLE